MAKARILKVVNYREEDIPLLQKLEEILKRESKEYTAWVRELTEDYVKKHMAGNPSFAITKWIEDSNFQAWPSLGSDWAKVDLKKFTLSDLDKMEGKLIELRKRVSEAYLDKRKET